MNDDLLAQLSNLAFVVAIAVYVLALLGFAADLAGSAQRRSDARLAARERAAVGAAGAGDKAGSVAMLDREPVAAPGASGSGGMSAGAFAMIMASAAATLHLAGVVLRGLATASVPWSNMYEFAMTGTAIVMAVFLLVTVRSYF